MLNTQEKHAYAIATSAATNKPLCLSGNACTVCPHCNGTGLLAYKLGFWGTSICSFCKGWGYKVNLSVKNGIHVVS